MSFTSKSEFDFQNRIQITNEVPLYDTYKGIHSALKNSVWKWFLGWQEMTYDTSMTNMDESERPIKLVNGVQSDVFGPSQTKTWNSKTKSYDYAWPEFRRMELNGNFIAETDLLMHEFYRYLDTLYPTHPDYMKLLTENEFNDMILNAAAIVDYIPNLKFLNTVTNALDTSLSENDLIDEAAKLKIRDLQANSFRRKFYGSKLGYRMYTGQVMNFCSVYPLGTYVPVKPAQKEKVYSPNGNYTDGVGRYDYAIQAVEGGKRKIDKLSPLLHRKFRLIDWLGESGKYIANTKTVNIFTGISLPMYDYSVFEFPNKLDVSSVAEAVAVGSFFENEIDSKGTTYVSGKYEVAEKYTEFNYDGATGDISTGVSDGTNHVRELATTKRNSIKYAKTYIMKSFDELFASLSVEDATSIIDGYPYQGSSKISYQNGSSSFLLSLFSRLSTQTKNEAERINFFIENPFHQGTLLMKPSESLLMYPETDSVQFTYANGMATGITTGDSEVNISDKAIVKKGQFISTQKLADTLSTDLYSVFQVMGLTKGQIVFDSDKFSNTVRDSLYGYAVPDVVPEALYGVLAKLDDDNYVFLRGKLEMSHSINEAGYEYPTGGKFSITSIPTTLDDELLRVIYGTSYTDLLDKKNYYENVIIAPDTSAADKLVAKSNIEAIEKAIYALKENRSKIPMHSSGVASDGTAYDFEGSHLFKGCQLVKFYKIEANYVERSTYWHEVATYRSGLITGINLGLVSVFPVIREGQLGFSDSIPSVVFAENKQYTITDGRRDSTINVAIANTQIEDLADKAGIFDVKPCNIPSTVLPKFSGVTVETNCKTFVSTKAAVEIESTIKDDEDTLDYITFDSDISKRAAQSLNVGDMVSGTGIPSDTYIIEVDDEYIRISNEATRKGTFILTYEVSLNCAPSDIDTNFNTFKANLRNASLYETINPFKHGVYPSKPFPAVSKAYIDGLADISMFKPFPDSFFALKKALHESQLEPVSATRADTGTEVLVNKNALVPATVKFEGDLFAEIALDKLLYAKNRAKVTPTLCNIEWLNYLEDAIGDISRGTDRVNVGAQLNLMTDTTGYYTLTNGQEYTDPNVKSFFATFNWKEDSFPAYAQIGQGGAGRRSWFKAIDDIVYPDVYGSTFFDDKIDNLDTSLNELTTNGGVFAKRSLWRDKGADATNSDTSKLDEYSRVEDLLFEVPLGEYDTQMKYAGHGDATNAITTIQLAFYKEEFKNITALLNKADEDALVLVSDTFESVDVLENISSSTVATINDATGFTADKNLADFLFVGQWEPKMDLEGNILYPAVTDAMKKAHDGGSTPYFVVDKGASFTDKNGSEAVFEDSSILFYHADTNGVASWKNMVFKVGCGAFESAFVGLGNVAYRGKITMNNIAIKFAEIWYAVSSDTTVSSFADLQNIFIDTCNRLESKQPLDTGNMIRMNHLYMIYCVEPNEAMYKDLQLFYTGRVVGIYFDTSTKTLKLFGMNTNTRFGSTIPMLIPEKMDVVEFREVIGRLSSSVNYKNTVPRVIDKTTTSFTLPRNCIAEGSANFKFVVDPEFISIGSRIVKDGDTYRKENGEVYFDITASAIFYNSDLDEFYVNSYEYAYNDSSEKWEIKTATQEMFAIKFADQEYFKNLHYMYGKYQLKKSQISGSSDVVLTPTLSIIDGLKFKAGILSTDDKILSVSPVKMRSFYSGGYESKAFNNHGELSGAIRSVSDDGKTLHVTEAPSVSEGGQAANTIALASRITKIFPMDKVSAGNYTIISDESVDLSEKYGEPSIVSITAGSKPASTVKTNDDKIDTKYYRNALVFAAGVDAGTPNALIPYGDESYFSAAAAKLSERDTVLDAISLTMSDKTKRTVTMYDKGGNALSIKPNIVKYYGDALVALCNNGIIYFNKKVPLLETKDSVKLEQYNAPLKGTALADDAYFDATDGTWYISYVYTDIAYKGLRVLYKTTDFIAWTEAFTGTEDTLGTYTVPDGIASDDYVPSPYTPKTAKCEAMAFAADKSGKAVYIVDDTIFMKSETKKDGGATVSDERYWKKATLPKTLDVTSISLRQMADPAAIYAMASSLYSATIAALDNLIAGTSSSDPMKAKYTTMRTLWPAPLQFVATNVTYNLGNSAITLVTSALNPTNIGGINGTYSGNIIPNSVVAYNATRDADGVFNYFDNYCNYMSDYLKYFCGANFTHDVLTSNIKKVHFLNDVTMLQLEHDEFIMISDNKARCKADIEDANNWNTSVFSDDTVFSTADGSKETMNTYFMVNNEIIPVSLGNKVEHMEKSFKIASMANDGTGTIVLGGYFYSKAEIDAKLKTSSETPFSYKYNSTYHVPAILVSTDGGASFNVANVSDTMAKTQISTVTFDGGEWKAYIIKDDGSIVPNVFKPDTDTDKSMLTWRLFADASTDAISGRVLQNTANGYISTLSGSDKIFAFSPIALDVSGSTFIVSATGSKITLSGNVIKKGTAGVITKVLLSFKTTKAITAPENYIAKSGLNLFVDDKNQFKVTTVYETGSKYDADRAYFYRECLPKKLLETYEGGYPSIREDDERRFYRYDESVDASGNLMYTAKTLMNGSGENILLCDENGNILIDPEAKSSILSLYDIVKSGYDFTYVANIAKEPLYDTLADAEAAGVFSTDSRLTAALRDISLAISQLNRSKSLPSADVASSTSLISIMLPYMYPYTALDECVRVISEREGVAITDVTKTTRFVSKTMSGNDYIYDTVNKNYPLMRDIIVDMVLNIPYFYADEPKIIVAPTLTYDDADSTTIVEPSGISGMFFHENGYGGHSENTDENWQENLPWEVDPTAFDDVFVKNDFGAKVFLVDNLGAKVISKKGVNEVKLDDSLSIKKTDMYKAVQKISLEHDGETDSVNIYKLTDNKAVVVSSNDYTMLHADESLVVDADSLARANGKLTVYHNNRAVPANEVSFSVKESDGALVNIDATGSFSLYGITKRKHTIVFSAMYKGSEYQHSVVYSVYAPISDALASSYGYITKGLNVFDYTDTGTLIENGAITLTMTIKADLNITKGDITVTNCTMSAFEKVDEDTYEVTVIMPDSYSGNASVALDTDYGVNDSIELYAIKRDTLTVSNERDSIAIIGSDYSYAKTRVSVYAGTRKYYLTKNDFTIEGATFTYTGDTLSITKVNSGVTSLNVIVNADGDNVIAGSFNLAVRRVSAVPSRIETSANVFDDNITTLAITPKSSHGKSIKASLYGTYGYVYVKKPKYANFKELLYNLGNIIDESSSASDIESKGINVTSIASDYSYIAFSDKLPYGGDADINDGKSHIIKIRVLTRSSIVLTPEEMAREDLKYHLDLGDIDTYVPDRVYFPANGFPAPPVVIGNTLFNSDSSYMYTKEAYANSNGKYVYLCDKDGDYIKYVVDDNALTSKKIVPKEDFTATRDARFNPRTPIYTSCKDWYKSEYYIEGAEQNPYWQILEFKDVFDATTKRFDQIVSVYEYKKASSSMMLSEVKLGDRYLNVSQGSAYAVYEDTLSVTRYTPFIDHKNGTLQFILTQPDSKYKTSEFFMKYGIYAINVLKGSAVFKTGGTLAINSIMSFSYTVNTKRNFANKLDKDSAIVQVSEVGVFNKSHQLIAYATFPPIEYNSDTQHVSFNLFVKEGSCSDID